MNPPKSWVSKAKQGFTGPKKFFGVPKNTKIDFLKKPEFCNLSEH